MENVNFVLFSLRPLEKCGFHNFLRAFWSDFCGEKLGDRNHAKHLSSCCVSSGPFSAFFLTEFGPEVMKKLQTLIILVLLAQIRSGAHKANT